MEHYSAIKGNELLIPTTTWIDLKGLMLRERKNKGHILYGFIYIFIVKWQTYTDGKQIRGCQELGWWGWWVLRLPRGSTREIFVVMEFSVSWLQWWLHKSTRDKRMIHTHCTNVVFLALTLYYSYTRSNRRGKLNKGYIGPPHTIIAASYKFIII